MKYQNILQRRWLWLMAALSIGCFLIVLARPSYSRIGLTRTIIIIFSRQNMPIDLYGLVLDQNDRPVVDAKVGIFTRKLFLTRLIDKNYHQQTNESGGFAVTGKVGIRVGIENITKPGYEFTLEQQVNTNFYLADTKVELPDQHHPLVLRMRKKGDVAVLVKRSASFYFSEIDSGQEKGNDFILGGNFGPGQITTTFMYNRAVVCDLKARGNLEAQTGRWSLTLAVMDSESGLLPSNELLYTAPESGYLPEVTFHVDQAPPLNPLGHETSYAYYNLPKFLYLRSRNGTIYSRLELSRIMIRRNTMNPYRNENRPLIEDSLAFGFDTTVNPFGDPILDQATELPGEVQRQIEEEVRSSYEHGERPPTPDLAARVRAWERSRPWLDRVNDWFK